MHHPNWRNQYVLWQKSSILVAHAVTRDKLSRGTLVLESDLFHTAIAPVLKFSQLFGVFPLHNVMERLPEKLTFKTVSLTCAVSGMAIFGGYSWSTLAVKRLSSTSGIDAINVAEPFFFGICATSTVLFWRLAQGWKTLIAIWSRTELVFLQKPFRKMVVRGRLRLVATTILLLAFVEHALSVGNNITNLHSEVMDCNWTIPDPVKYFFVKTFGSTFYTIPYNLPVAIYNEYIVISMTYAWNFVDLFIVLVSIGLSTRFRQLNHHIADRIRQPTPTSEQFWNQIRIHYVSLCELVETCNRSVSQLVFVSFANDLYFICLQIMNASQEHPFLINKIYFTFSFMYLLLRTFLMFWFSAQVQDASHAPCQLILRVPNDEYCEELQRVQMYSKRGVSLTGMGVFLVSRRILLTIAGTILTYELVLLSYQEQSNEQTNSTSCEPLQLT